MALCLICVLCGTASCHDEEMIESTLKFKNISSETVYVIMANAGVKSQDFHLPYSADQFDADEVAPGEDSLIDFVFFDRYEYEHYKDKYRFALFVLKKSTMDKYTVEQIIHDKIYDKMLVYTYDELRAINFQINYMGE